MKIKKEVTAQQRNGKIERIQKKKSPSVRVCSALARGKRLVNIF
jgi:hypothetical protein